MAMDPCLKETLQQTIHVAQSTGRDASGDPSFGDPVARKARVEVDRRPVINADTGVEEVTSHRIVLEESVGPYDRIWLPGVDKTDGTLSRRPKQVEIAPDEYGATHHYEVLV